MQQAHAFDPIWQQPWRSLWLCCFFMSVFCAAAHLSNSAKKPAMPNIHDSLQSLMKLDGALAAAVVDANSGILLGKAGGGINLEVAAAGNTEVVRAKMKTMRALGLTGSIEDMLITLQQQYHIITLIKAKEGLFLYTVLEKSKANLAMARYKANEVQTTITM